jgi:phosphotransferase system enzyme I (PtsI)
MHKGVAVSPGVVVGVAHRVESVFAPAEPQELPGPDCIPAEIERFDLAVDQATAELEQVVQKVAEQLGSGEADIFESHLTLIHDEALLDRVRDLIRSRGYTASSALQIVLQDYAALFARSEHEYFRERVADLRDVVGRIGSRLSVPAAGLASGFGVEEPPGDGHANGQANGVEPGGEGAEPIILVAHEILPSQAMSLGNLPIAGIVTEVGGGTSHAAILSRSRGIPAVSGCTDITSDVRTGDLVVVDGREGVVLIRPDAETVSAYRKVQREFFQLKGQLVLNRDQPAVSKDGVQVELLANINNVADARSAEDVGATGVGLFRTEYLFITHPDVPDEEEQYEYYREVIEASPGRSVTIRTLDLGGDKTVPYLGSRNEPNPFMGWRSIRLSFEHPKLFERQIRAILRAGRHGKVSMLFPMITTLEELRHVNRLVDEAKRNLRREGIPFGEDVKTGVMVEVPAAAVCIDAILRETDFISIGSNDLIQYLVAADRDNPKVAHLCEPLSPAIFRVLQMVFDACRRTGTPVTLCGEMAGQPRSVLVLLGMGLRRFSMSPAFVPTIKALLTKVTTAQAERFAHQVLQQKTSEEIRKYLTARMHEVSSDLEVFDFV